MSLFLNFKKKFGKQNIGGAFAPSPIPTAMDTTRVRDRTPQTIH